MAAASEQKLPPIIVKKIKKVSGGHHGGAWKVAYADFVTAMMAFFLLLWLLATTTPEQRKGIAEYFTPTVGLKDSKGIGFEGGLTPNEKGSSRTNLSQPGLVAGQIKQEEQKNFTRQSNKNALEDPGGGIQQAQQKKQETELENQDAQQRQKEDKLKDVQSQIESMFETQKELKQLRKNLIITNTPEGLKLDVVDDPKQPMFIEGTATMTDKGRLMFKALSGVILKTENKLSISGHTETMPFPVGETYTNWEISADRANSTRRYLSENITEPDRVAEVTGMADQDLLLPKEPQSMRNRRISLLLLRNQHVANFTSAPSSRGLISSPSVSSQEINEKKFAPPPPKPEPVKPAEPAEEKGPTIFAPAYEESEKKGFEAPEGASSGSAMPVISTVPSTEYIKKAAPAPKPVELIKPEEGEKGPGMFDPNFEGSANKGFVAPEE